MSLAPAGPAPAVALPVQRAPATPAATPAATSAQAQRQTQMQAQRKAPAPASLSTPLRGTSVAVQRKGGGGGGARGSGGSAPPPVADFSSGGGSSGPPPPSVTSQFKPRELQEDQMAELVHRLVGPLTRLLRTELRLDRERVGKLRDPRH
ncbi:extensin [Streptomyces paludis]|uniref:Extensin n=1 Tax=Streptomyces paludis TaxID=2282738 RepID=A0A345HLJ0_9ACTN|nr:extensin [Streptomyces paludis]